MTKVFKTGINVSSGSISGSAIATQAWVQAQGYGGGGGAGPNFTTNVSISNSSGSSQLTINDNTSTFNGINFNNANTPRWQIDNTVTDEVGSNFGGDLRFDAYDDSGNYLYTPLRLYRYGTIELDPLDSAGGVFSIVGKAYVSDVLNAASNVIITGAASVGGNPVYTKANAPYQTQTFNFTGVVAVYTSSARLYNDTGAARSVVSVRASVGTAPTGAAMIVDVRKNSTNASATIFTGSGINIPVSTFTSGASTSFNSGSLIAAGDYLTVAVKQIGSTIAGSDLSVQVNWI